MALIAVPNEQSATSVQWPCTVGLRHFAVSWLRTRNSPCFGFSALILPRLLAGGDRLGALYFRFPSLRSVAAG